MANMLFANNCNTTLASSLTSGATSMSVTSATGFPSPTGVQYFYCTLADAATQTTIEIVKVTSVTGTTFAITRAQDGTSATAFAAGAVVSLRLVRASLNDFPKLDETNTFNADQAISGQLTSSAGLATTGTFTATAPSDGLVMDYATGFGRFSAFAGDGFQWYNAGIANTKLMQLSSSGVITTATWNGTTVGVSYGGTGASTASITAFNNITGYTASGATGTTSTNLVFSTSPTLVTPVLGAATATSIQFGSSSILNDYEYGTWTPALGRTGTAPSVTYSTQIGYYFKIGNQVTVNGVLTWTAYSGGTGGFTITGLPYTCHNLGGYYPAGSVGYYDGITLSVGGTQLSVIGGANITYMFMESSGSGVGSNSPSAIASSGDISFTLTYSV